MTAFDNSLLVQEQKNGAHFDPLSSPSLDSVSGKSRPLIYICCCKESSASTDEKEATDRCSRFSIICCHQELEQERIAAESAANEAVSMILRLQAEKAALLIEARYYQELFEARSLYDEQTISQLRHVISSQEADRITLEREIEECKQALHMLSNYMQDKYRQSPFLEDVNSCEDSSMDPNALSSILHANEGRFKPTSAEESFDCSNAHLGAKTQQIEFTLPNDSKEEAKTKQVLSTKCSNPLLNDGPGDFISGAHAAICCTCLATVDHHLKDLELVDDHVACGGNWHHKLVKEYWLPIVMQFLNMENHIWSLGFSKVGTHHPRGNYPPCCLNYNDDACADIGRDTLCPLCLQGALQMNKFSVLKAFWLDGFDSGDNELPRAADSCVYISGLTKVGKENDLPHACNKQVDGFEQQEKHGDIHVDSWNEVLNVAGHCVKHLQEQFASIQSRLHGLEAVTRAMVEAVMMMPQRKDIFDNIVFKASNLLKECLSLTGLSCEILEILHKLGVDLMKASNLEERSANTKLSSQLKINNGRIQEDTYAASEEWPGAALTVTQGDSPHGLWSTLSKSAFVWLSSLDWLSNERCRAETALSGWDHV